VRRVFVAVAAALILCVAGLVVVVVAGREEEQLAVDNLLAERLSLEIARSEVLRMEDVTTFPWDTLLIVERGTPDEEIERSLTGEWTGGVNFETGDLLLFVRNGRVERYADYRGEGRFENVERPVAEFTRDDAVFRVDDLVITPTR
jgi:hypothetical protein